MQGVRISIQRQHANNYISFLFPVCGFQTEENAIEDDCVWVDVIFSCEWAMDYFVSKIVVCSPSSSQQAVVLVWMALAVSVLCRCVLTGSFFTSFLPLCSVHLSFSSVPTLVFSPSFPSSFIYPICPIDHCNNIPLVFKSRSNPTMSVDTNPHFHNISPPPSTLLSLVSKFDPALAALKHDVSPTFAMTMPPLLASPPDSLTIADLAITSTTNNNVTPTDVVIAQYDHRDLQTTSSDFVTKRQNFESSITTSSIPIPTTAFTVPPLDDATTTNYINTTTTTTGHYLSKTPTSSTSSLTSRVTSASDSVSTSVSSSPSLSPLLFVATTDTTHRQQEQQQALPIPISVTPPKTYTNFHLESSSTSTTAAVNRGHLQFPSNYYNNSSASTTIQSHKPSTLPTPIPPKPTTVTINMSTSPTTTTSPMANPNLSGHSNLFNHTNNHHNGVLRSPSTSSNGKVASSGGSASSATTANSSTLTGNGSGTTVASSVSGGHSGLAGSGISSSGVSDIKLKRFLEHNQRLQEQLEMRRISVSEASQRYVMEELFFMCVCFAIFHLCV